MPYAIPSSLAIRLIDIPCPCSSAILLLIASGIGGRLVRFKVTENHLQMLDQREITNVASLYREPTVINAWPVTNVDIKYRVNLDGEITNFVEENQELDWQVRQWVKLSFAKNDMSDLAPFFGDLNPVLMNCTNVTDASAAILPRLQLSLFDEIGLTQVP